jgi:hypothetical protein
MSALDCKAVLLLVMSVLLTGQQTPVFCSCGGVHITHLHLRNVAVV